MELKAFYSKHKSLVKLVVIIVIIALLFPKQVGGYVVFPDCNETLIAEGVCGEHRTCDCLGYEYKWSGFGGRGSTYYCIGWPINCS